MPCPCCANAGEAASKSKMASRNLISWALGGP
jgi:hypothetical protein